MTTTDKAWWEAPIITDEFTRQRAEVSRDARAVPELPAARRRRGDAIAAAFAELQHVHDERLDQAVVAHARALTALRDADQRVEGLLRDGKRYEERLTTHAQTEATLRDTVSEKQEQIRRLSDQVSGLKLELAGMDQRRQTAADALEAESRRRRNVEEALDYLAEMAAEQPRRAHSHGVSDAVALVREALAGRAGFR